MRSEALDIDAINYKYGPKNQWRRSVWNAIARLVPKPREALVLYLSGAANLDRDIAVQKGFDARNLIAVERDLEAAEYLRKEHKQNTIHADLIDVMNMWSGRPVAAVIGDFTSGCDSEVIATLSPFVGNPALANCVYVVNVMRGREQSDNAAHMRALIHELPEVEKAFGKSRVIQLFVWLAVTVGRQCYPIDNEHLRARYICDLFSNGMMERCFYVHKLPSYQSTSRQLFDSVVLKDRGHIQRMSGEPPGGYTKRELYVRDCIRAALAHRTRKFQ